MKPLPLWMTGPDRWVRVDTVDWRSINLKYMEDVDWKPGAIILWFAGEQGCEVPHTNRCYQEILDWLAQYGIHPYGSEKTA